jgi:hypothetical protein
MPKSKTTSTSVANQASKALTKSVSAAIASIKAAREDLEGQGLASKTQEERLYSNGKLREGEAEVMTVVLDTMDRFPGIFASLAARDHGEDDKVLETGPARAALARMALLKPLQAELEALLTRVSDDILECAELVKDVTSPGYAIIKANEAVAPEVRKASAPAITYYANLSRRRRKPAEK